MSYLHIMKVLCQLPLLLVLFLTVDAGAGLRLKNRQQIIMLGDSLTEGEDPDGYVKPARVMLAEVYPGQAFYIANAGKGGDTAVTHPTSLRTNHHRSPCW